MPRQELTPEQKLQKQVSAMTDSENLIRKLVAENVHSESIHDTIDRNVRHLEIMFERDVIKSSNTNLTPFQEAVSLGKSFVAA